MKLKSIALTLSALSLCSCGDQSINSYETKRSTGQNLEVEADATADTYVADEVIAPPQEYYDALLGESLNLVDQQDLNADGTQVLFINFNGATIKKGYGADKSFLLCKSSATIPESGHTQSEQQDIIDQVQAYYDEANARINVVAAEPEASPYTTIHVGGSYRDLGCVGNSVLGIAPFDRGNANKNDIAFSFTPARYSVETAAQTIAHEAGHSFGLDHINNKKGIMYPSITSSIEGFRSGTIKKSFSTQDSPAVLRANLGEGTGNSGSVDPVENPSTPSTPTVDPIANIPNTPNLGNVPDLNNLVPNLGSVISGISNGGVPQIPGLDMISSLGTLLPTLTGGSIMGPSIINSITGGVIPTSTQNIGGLGDILTIISSVGQAGGLNPVGGVFPTDINSLVGILNPATLPVGGLDQLIGSLGNGQNTQAGITNVLQTIMSSQTQQPSPTSLPDLAGLVGISQVQDISQLLSLLNAQSAIVNSNFQGSNATALNSLLKAAYSQQFQAISINN